MSAMSDSNSDPRVVMSAFTSAISSLRSAFMSAMSDLMAFSSVFVAIEVVSFHHRPAIAISGAINLIHSSINISFPPIGQLVTSSLGRFKSSRLISEFKSLVSYHY